MRDDEPGPSRASARVDEPISSEWFDDGPTEEDLRVTVLDVYGGEFTHHIWPIPEAGSLG